MSEWREAVAESKRKFAMVTTLRAARKIVNDLRCLAQKLGEEPCGELGVTIDDLAAVGQLNHEQGDLLEALQLACSDECVVFANRTGVVLVSTPDYETDIITWADATNIVKARTSRRI